MMKIIPRILLAGLCALPLFANAASFVEKMQPGVKYYYENFDPEQRPWDPGQDLNYEEVFKNYEFYEIVLDAARQEVTVNRFIQNNKSDSQKYRLLPDGALRRM
jgi:hypothetical protein